MKEKKRCQAEQMLNERTLNSNWRKECWLRYHGRCCIDCPIICRHRCSPTLFVKKPEEMKCFFYLTNKELFYKKVFE